MTPLLRRVLPGQDRRASQCRVEIMARPGLWLVVDLALASFSGAFIVGLCSPTAAESSGASALPRLSGAEVPTSASVPNEPPGFVVATEHSFANVVEDGWLDCCELAGGAGEGPVSLGNDPAAPKSPPGVASVTYPAGFNSQRSVRDRPIAGKELFVSYWYKHSQNWVGAGYDGIGFLEIGGKPHVRFYSFDQAPGEALPAVMLGGVIGASDPLVIVTPTVANPPRLAHGAWHQLEVHIKANTEGNQDGFVKWWVDGQLYGDHAMGLWFEEQELRFRSIGWHAGLSGSPAQDQTFSIDHLYVSRPAAPTSGPDEVSLQANAGNDQSVVLLDGTLEAGGASTCTNDLLLTGSGTVAVQSGGSDGNMRVPASCAEEIAVFSQGDATFYEPTDANIGWTDAAGDVEPVTLPSGLLNVPTKVYVAASTNQADALALAKEGIANAQGILDAQRSGIRLAGSTSGGTPLFESLAGDAVGQGCDTFDVARANGKYDPEVLNIYFVPQVFVRGYPKHGYTCIEYSLQNVAYVQWNPNCISTMIHEIGHALGLSSPKWGHTANIADMDQSNVMMTGCETDVIDPDIWEPGDPIPLLTAAFWRDHLTVGQSFRLNVGEHSWVNAPRPSGSSVREEWFGFSPATQLCACDPAATDERCPAMPLDDPSTGTVPIPTADERTPVCQVTLVGPSSVTLDCGETHTAAAELYLEFPSTPALGDRIWISDDPNVVSVDQSGLLRGITASGVNPTVVSVWSGGISASILVTVAGSNC